VNLQVFLAELYKREIQLRADGDQLRCKAPAGVLTSELRSQLMERKNEILAFLRTAQTAAQQPRAIVPLQPNGARAPIFAVAGHNGDVFTYRTFALELGKDQPFFGLEPPGLLDGDSEIVPGISVRLAPGHNRDMQLVFAESSGQTFCFFSDLVPSTAHLTPTWVAAFDLYPLESIEKKIHWLGRAADEKWICGLGHDHKTDFTRVERAEGKFPNFQALHV